MLKFLRKKKTMKRIIWGLAILIIPAFVLWGAGSGNKKRRKGPNYAGKLFNRKVSFEEYTNMWRVTRDYAVRRFGQNVPPEFIDQMAWNRIFLLEGAKKENIAVKDSEIVEKITSFPVFQRDGYFDKKLYKSMLGDKARRFEEKLRDDIRLSKLREKITSGVSIDGEEVKKGYKKKFEKIKASYIPIAFAGFEKDVGYEESELVTFYEKDKEAFRKPDEINVKYIEIQEEDPAYNALDKTLDKKNLDEAASFLALETKETGFFNMQQEIPGIGWSYEFTKAGFQLKPGEIFKTLIKKDDVFYIIQLKEKKASYLPEFAEVKDNVVTSFIKNKSVKLSEKKATKLYLKIKRKIKNGEVFENIAKESGQEVKETDFIARSDYIPTLGPAREFVETGVFLKPGEIAGPLKMPESWVILKLDGYKEIDEAEFTKEKEGFEEKMLSGKKEEFFNKWTRDLKNKANFVSYTLE